MQWDVTLMYNVMYNEFNLIIS